MTNLEKIRAMSAEELAKFLFLITECCYKDDCENCPLYHKGVYCNDESDVRKWLESEVEE